MRDQEAPPVRRAFFQLDDDDDDVLLAKAKNKGRLDGNKSSKEKIGLRDKIDEMMKSKENLVNKTLEIMLMMMERRSQ